MLLIAALDEAIIGADSSLALTLHAMPAAWLVAFGLVVIGLALSSGRLGKRIRAAIGIEGGGQDPAPFRPTSAERSMLAVATEARPAGARGARSPGRGVSRPALHG